MTQHVNAIFEHGVLKPLGPVDLQEQQVVSIFIETAGNDGASETSDEDRTLFELLDKAGLIGCVKDAPSDLSTNPKYLEGFGKSET
jgi:predicted DNA-binding antitoxin AbrB/MazE fold protein